MISPYSRDWQDSFRIDAATSVGLAQSGAAMTQPMAWSVLRRMMASHSATFSYKESMSLESYSRQRASVPRIHQSRTLKMRHHTLRSIHAVLHALQMNRIEF